MAAIISDEAKERIKAWKARFEELEVQLNLGEKEAETRVEEGKRKFQHFINATKVKFPNFWLTKEDVQKHLTSQLDELKVQVDLGSKEARDRFEDARKDLKKSIDRLQEKYAESKLNGDGKLEDFLKQLDKESLEFKTKLDIFWLHLNLAKADAADEFEVRRKELKAKLRDLKSKLDEAVKGNAEKWNDFTKEFKEAFVEYGEFDLS